MKGMITLLLVLAVSQSAFAQDFTGKLQCFPSVMNKNNPGILEDVKISGADANNVAPSIFGQTVVADLADASAGKGNVIQKTLTNDKVFDGEIQMSLGFVYKGDIAAGNLEGVSLTLEHKGKDFWGKEKTYAQASGTYPLTQDGTIEMDLFSTGGNLLEVQVQCGISKN